MSDFNRRIRRHSKRNITKSKPKQNNEQAIILSGLNVMQVLEDNAPKYLQRVLHYGPDSFVGDGWAAVLIWYRRKGYQNYQDLILFGMWAVHRDDSPSRLIIGTKPLKYTAPVFNPESYHSVIRQDFKVYYQDDGRPPAENRILYETEFDITRRLALRREIAEKLVYWLRNSIIQK